MTPTPSVSTQLLLIWVMVLLDSRCIRKADGVLIHQRGEELSSRVCVQEVLDIEESIWSPNFGLKGKIDASVQVQVHQRNSRLRRVVPLELKTGKSINNVSHRAQTALYTVMMSDRYGKAVALSILSWASNSMWLSTFFL
jgi:DNA replication ATP-dependent helicase Dna2